MPRIDYDDNYRSHLVRCRDWLVRTKRASGGSAAHFGPFTGWSKAYPETTGYIITTLLDLEDRLGDGLSRQTAIAFGDWLVGIQDKEGYWQGGLYPYGAAAGPSVFNTGQILNGLVALCRRGHDAFREPAARAAAWLAAGVGSDGIWNTGHYRGHQPDYYSFVTWPMLDYAALANDSAVAEAARRVLTSIMANRQENGSFTYWGFDPGRPAFSHTVAYTLQGLIESDRLLGGGTEVLESVLPALERLRRHAELNEGRIAGSFGLDWKADKSFECLTGSAQVAICFLLLHRRSPDLQMVNAAAKIVERLCLLQSDGPIGPLRGALAGSRPLHGPYMRLRYPNWAVKFFADSLMMLSDALNEERRGT